MAGDKRRGGALRPGAAAAIWRRWVFTLLASLLLYLLNPRAWSLGWIPGLHAAYLGLAFVETGALLFFPGLADRPGFFVATNSLSLAQVGVAVALTGGPKSPLVLLYPLIMVSGILAGPHPREMFLVGAVGFATFAVASWASLRPEALVDHPAFLAEAVLMFLFSISLAIVANVIAEKNVRLECSNRALEKFAAGLKATNEKLERLSFTDGVTGVYNYRYFQLRLREELSRARRYRLPLALMMVDVDSFKRYNDSHGHPIGDRVLQAVAAALKENVRELDTVCRYGGDEFAVILNDAGAETATAIAERVRGAVERCAGLVGAPPGITVSLGIAIYPDNAESAEELVKRADEALYRIKLSRRNAVQVYSSVIEDLRSELGEVESPTLLNTLQTLITVINARDRYTYGHSERVMRYALLIGQQLGLKPEDLRLLRYAAFLHDIGKIEIGRDILNKRGPLTEEERNIIKHHTLYGVQIIEPIHSLEKILRIVLHHHERFDGRGYPAGLAGEDIPLLARVLAVADAFDAMRSHRPYREAMSLEQALEEIRRGRGSQFDPVVAEAFLAAASEHQELCEPDWRENRFAVLGACRP
ncbi:MAG: diguanylate cyclase [Bacillota bacterium]|nr:diguanylate cyclase [Bacillota bacterium]